MATTLLTVSVVIQLVTVWMALRLIRISGGRLSWILLALAFVARASRHIWRLGQVLLGYDEPVLVEDIISVGGSVLALAGVCGIGPLFVTLQKLLDEKQTILEKVEQSATRLQTIFGIIHEGLIIADRKGTLTDWNPAALALHGFEYSQNIPKSLEELAAVCRVSTPEGVLVPLSQWPMRRALDGETFADLELKFAGPEGSNERILRFSGSSIADRSGEVALAVLSMQDVTSAKWAEKALLESEKRFRLLAESAPVGVLETDGGGRFHYANPRWFNISGQTPAESADKGWQLALHPQSRSNFDEAWAATGRGSSRSWNGEFLIQRPNGQEIWTNVLATLVATEDSEPAMIAGIFEDISERKAVELELRRAMELSETANRTKTEFLANISHEIRTPMTIFMGMLDLVLDSPLSEDQRHYLETARNAAETLLILIEDILDFSRIEAGEFESERKPFLVASCLKLAMEMFAEKARQKGLEMHLTIAPDVPAILVGDERRIRQVLTNLLANAVKFTERGDIAINVTFSQLPSAAGELSLSVRDTGIGIPPDKFALLFQRFSQLDGSSTRKYGGSGLGLALCKAIVEGMGGSIGVESVPEQGCTFTFRLPAEAPAMPSQPSPSAARRKPAPAASNARILLAEDEGSIAELTTHLLRSWGWSVIAAPNGAQALERFRDEPFDLVLMDLQMPGMDGLEATRRIRAYERDQGRAAVPIIALTAHAHEEDRARCLAAGMDELVSKPIDCAALSRLLQSRLKPPSPPIS